MLTHSDLEQISQLLDRKLDEKLDQKFEEKLAPINKQLKSHSKALRSLKKDQEAFLDMLDREQIRHRERLEIIERVLKLPTPAF